MFFNIKNNKLRLSLNYVFIIQKIIVLLIMTIYVSTYFYDKSKYLNIGWYKLKKKKSHKILENIPDETHMYFVHSYVCKPESEKVILTETFYNNNRFCSSIQNENLFGFQFHPEKSGEKGLNIYYSLKKLL